MKASSHQSIDCAVQFYLKKSLESPKEFLIKLHVFIYIQNLACNQSILVFQK